jgi:hypothetical protein
LKRGEYKMNSSMEYQHGRLEKIKEEKNKREIKIIKKRVKYLDSNIWQTLMGSTICEGGNPTQDHLISIDKIE